MSRERPADDVVFRRFTEDDLSSLVALMEHVPEVARSGDDISMQAAREQLSWPGHVPTRDRWVVALRSDPERLVGYSAVFKTSATPRADFAVAVHPSMRRRGLGSELLHRALADAEALGASDAACYVSGRDASTPDFLAHRDFEPVAAYVELVARSDQYFPLPQWPEGFTVRSWRDAADLTQLVEALNRCYEGQWGHSVSTAEEWKRWLPSIDTTGISFLFGPDGELAGIVRAEMRDGIRHGVVDAPGVAPRWRDMGLYRLLLLHAIRWFCFRDPIEYRIESWGDDPAVISDYQALGFAVSRRDALYRRRLGAHVDDSRMDDSLPGAP